MKIKSLFAAVGVIGLLVSGGASADWSWSFTGSGQHAMSFNRASTAHGETITTTATGWQNEDSYSGGNLLPTPLGLWSGLGVDNNEGYPEHATDNKGRIDSVLLSFNQPVELSTVRFGWTGGNDSDFTVAAFTGDDGADNDTNLANLTYATLADHGWSTIGNYYNPGTSTTRVNSGEKSSSYWLVSALNPKLGSINCCAGNDYFKLMTVGATTPSGPPPGIPEPSTISLLLLGLLMAGYLSSQKRQRAAGRLAA